jgi:hypothetical protein
MKKQLLVILLLLSSFGLFSQIGVFQLATIDSTWAPPGATWYYQNQGKDSANVKHIRVDRVGDTLYKAGGINHIFYPLRYNKLLFSYLDRNGKVLAIDSYYTARHKDTIWSIEMDSGKFLNPTTYITLYAWEKLYNSVKYYTLAWTSINKLIYDDFEYIDTVLCEQINGFNLKRINIRHYNNHNPRLGDILERIGSVGYFFPLDTFSNSLYGGKLIWYYDPQFGKYEVGKTKVDTCMRILGINGNIESNLLVTVYPNPCFNYLMLQLKSKTPGECSINSIEGIQKWKGLVSTDIDINTMGWAKGLYIIRITTGNLSQILKVLKV